MRGGWVRRSPGRLPPGTVLSVKSNLHIRVCRLCLYCPGLCTHIHISTCIKATSVLRTVHAQPPCPPIHITAIISTHPHTKDTCTNHPSVNPPLHVPIPCRDHLQPSAHPADQLPTIPSHHHPYSIPSSMQISTYIHTHSPEYISTLDLLTYQKCIHTYIHTYMDYAQMHHTTPTVSHSTLARPAHGKCPRRRS